MLKILSLLSLVVVMPFTAFAATAPKPMVLCVTKTGAIQAKAKCGKTETIFTTANLQSLGVKGDVGSQGPQGIQGPQGLKGDKGDQGLQGPPGSQGAKGDVGSKGDKGDKGDQGLQGIPGSQGVKGDTGPKGDAGLINTASCYSKESVTPPSGFQSQGVVLFCDNSDTDFMLTRGFTVQKGGATGIVSLTQEQLQFNKGMPTGTAISLIASTSSGNSYGTTGTIVCCKR